MVGDGDEPPGLERGVDRTAGIGEDEALDPEPPEDPDAEHDLRGRHTLVQVRTAPHHGDRDAAERPEDERARVAHGSRHGPARDLGVRDLVGVLDRVGEPAEAAAEDDTDARPGAALRLERGNRLVELAQAEPSARRWASIDVTISTASSGSSVSRSRSRSPGETSPPTSIRPRIQSSSSRQ